MPLLRNHLLILWLALFLSLFAGCASYGHESPPPTPTTTRGPGVTPTSPPAPSPVATASGVTPAFRDFAGMTDRALQENDIDFFRERTQTEPKVCGPDDLRRAGRANLCERIGQEYEGLGLAYHRSDEGGMVLVDTALMMIEDLGCRQSPGASISTAAQHRRFTRSGSRARC